jgi:hypothetical protein
LPDKKTSFKDDTLLEFFEQDKYLEDNSRSKKNQKKSFEGVMKSIKTEKRDDYIEETAPKKREKPIFLRKTWIMLHTYKIILLHLRTLEITEMKPEVHSESLDNHVRLSRTRTGFLLLCTGTRYQQRYSVLVLVVPESMC